LNPEETYQFCLEMTTRYPGLHFDFHAHNDYDLSVANSWSALRAGIKGVHTTVNGLGERAGNTPLSSMIAVIKDQLKMETRVNEEKITPMSRMVETFSGIRIPSNKPIIGENVFTQACGVHADGDNKNSLYFNELLPERFGRVRKYALGKTSGKSNILKNLQEMGIDLDPESMKKITQRVIELGDRKENVTADDLPYIMSDVLKHESIRQNIKVVNYSLSVAEGLKSSATLMIEINGKNYQETSAGDGQYDAFMNALHKIYKGLNLEIPRLTDYVVTIPPGGKTDALVETVITWDLEGREFKTRGLDPDQTAAAIKATVRMLNYIS
jgi:D-citramalate synthase